MEGQLSKLYSILVNQIVTMIPVEWSEIYYWGEVEKGRKSCSTVFYYKDKDTNAVVRSHSIPNMYDVSMKIYGDAIGKLEDILIELYSCFENNEQKLWERIYLFIY